jgi:hypothetical protein
VAPGVENREDDSKGDCAEDDDELQDGVSQEVSSFRMVLLESEDLESEGEKAED